MTKKAKVLLIVLLVLIVGIIMGGIYIYSKYQERQFVRINQEISLSPGVIILDIDKKFQLPVVLLHIVERECSYGPGEIEFAPPTCPETSYADFLNLRDLRLYKNLKDMLPEELQKTYLIREYVANEGNRGAFYRVLIFKEGDDIYIDAKEQSENCLQSIPYFDEICWANIFNRVKNESSNVCNKFYGDEAKKSCLQYFKLAEAINTNNGDLCLDIEKQGWRNRCLNSIAFSTNNPELCKEMQFFAKDYGSDLWLNTPDGCYYDIAKRVKNIDFCNEIKDSGFKSECLNVVSK